MVEIHEGFVVITYQPDALLTGDILPNTVINALRSIRPTMWRLLFIDVSKVEVLNEELKASLLSLQRLAQGMQAQAMLCGSRPNTKRQLMNNRAFHGFRYFSSIEQAFESWLG